MGYTCHATLDLSQIDQVSREEPLRAAVVRQGRVLGSRLIDLHKIERLSAIPVEVGFDLPRGEDAAGLELRIGPDVPDRVLPYYEAFTLTPDAAALRALKPGATLTLGTAVLKADVYKAFWLRCKRYTVTGRVVRRVAVARGFCDEPVPGATVTAYDVDRVLFWYRKDVVRTAVTGIDGRFSMSFRWCCTPWLYVPHEGWIVRPEEWWRLRELLQQLRQRIPSLPLPIPDPNPPDPVALTKLLETVEALARAPSIGPLPMPAGPGVRVAPTAPALLQPPIPELRLPPLTPAVLPEVRRLLARFREICPPWWWQRRPDCSPDLIFRATQAVDGVQVIYDEDVGDTRWDVSADHPLDVTLMANSKAVSIGTCGPAAPAGDCFKFVRVGVVQAPEIGGLAAGPLAGYHMTPGAPDQPFGGTLDLHGLFGAGTLDVDYYKLQIAPFGGDPAVLPSDSAFADVPAAWLGTVYQYYYEATSPADPVAHPVQVVFGPTVVGSTSGLYRTVESFQRGYAASHGGPPGPWGWMWTHRDWLANVNTSYLPDGLYVMRLVGYHFDGTNLAGERILRACSLDPATAPVELLPLRLDNRALVPAAPGVPAPDLNITAITVNGVNVPEFVCRQIVLKAGDQVTISFKVTDPHNHLSDFSLVGLYRIGCAMAMTEPPQFTVPNTYAEHLLAPGAVRPSWGGGSYTVTVTVAQPSPGASCSSCGSGYFPFSGAYDLRLGAWKRTTNGYGRIHYGEVNATIVVVRGDGG